MHTCFRALLAALSIVSAAPVHADLVLTGAPRETGGQGDDLYLPLADYLSKLTGQKVVYRAPDNWLTYQSEMQKDRYDIMFDGPHFVSWRINHTRHQPLVKLPGNLSFVVIVRKEQTGVETLKDLAGRTLCVFAPPNFGTLTVLNGFDNPSRQPKLVEVKGITTAYDNVLAGKCVAGIMTAKVYEGLEQANGKTRVVHHSKPAPNQAISASSRVGPELRQKIINGLLNTPEGKQASSALRAQFKGQDFVATSTDEYQGLDEVLKDVWGFNR